MKRIIIVLLFLSVFTIKAQTRELTLSTENGVNLSNEFLHQSSVNLYYEFNKKIYLSSWTGVGFRQNRSSWLSNISTINKKFKKYSIGTGILFVTGNQSSVIHTTQFNKNLYGIIKISYKIKL